MSICSVEKYRERTPDAAIEMYDYLISLNCRPSIAAASSTYLYGVLTNQKSSQTIIADHFGTTVHSIGKWYQELVENEDSWEIKNRKEKSELLASLPTRRPRGEENITKDELINEVRGLYDLESKRYSASHLDSSDIHELTGETDVFSQKEVLEDEFGLRIEPGDDASIQININKSGVAKIRDHYYHDSK